VSEGLRGYFVAFVDGEGLEEFGVGDGFAEAVIREVG